FCFRDGLAVNSPSRRIYRDHSIAIVEFICVLWIRRDHSSAKVLIICSRCSRRGKQTAENSVYLFAVPPPRQANRQKCSLSIHGELAVPTQKGKWSLSIHGELTVTTQARKWSLSIHGELTVTTQMGK